MSWRCAATLMMSLTWIGILGGVSTQAQAPGDTAPGVTSSGAPGGFVLDVITRQPSTGRPANLKLENFQLFDNDQRVQVTGFRNGAQFQTRPLAVWFVVMCNMTSRDRNWDGKSSAQFAGRINLFNPALKLLDKKDRVGVAHWCHDSTSKIDLELTADSSAAVATLETVLHPVLYKAGGRTAEFALQQLIRMLVKPEATPPAFVPVLVFLYDDLSGMTYNDIDRLVDHLRATSAIVYGIVTSTSPEYRLYNREAEHVIHQLADATGGRYGSAMPDRYAVALGEIIQELHFRYELGFAPAAVDGRAHKLTVKLANLPPGAEAVELRHYPAYKPRAAN